MDAEMYGGIEESGAEEGGHGEMIAAKLWLVERGERVADSVNVYQ